MNITIRKGNPADVHAVFLLIQEFAIFQKTPYKVTTSPLQMEADQNLFTYFVAETNQKEIIGFASYFFTYHSWTGKALYLDDLYVTANFRGNNIGTKLLETVITLAKQENCKSLRWLVSDWNEKAISFYQKMGATIDKTEITCSLDLTLNKPEES